MRCHFCGEEFHIWERLVILYSHDHHPEVKQENDEIHAHEEERRAEEQELCVATAP
jgi:hypothetical protein